MDAYGDSIIFELLKILEFDEKIVIYYTHPHNRYESNTNLR